MTQSSGRPALGGEVLIVDDDPDIADLLTHILGSNGYRTRAMTDSGAALVAAVEDPPDLILLDVNMPDTDGFQFCRQLKESESAGDVPVIFISASEDISDQVRAFELGGVDFVTKPLNASIVLERIALHRRLSRTLETLRTREDDLKQHILDLEEARERFERQAERMAELAENEAALKQKAEEDGLWVRTIFETVSDAIVVIDRQGVIETFNGGAETIFGYSPDEAVGRNVSMLMPEPDSSRHDGYLARSQGIAGKTVIGTTRELHGLRKNGETFPISLTLNSVRLGDDVKYTGIVRDITRRKKAEEEIRKLAMTDQLTGLANRNQYHQRFQEHLNLARREGEILALMLLDLDKFKPVNDTHGHPVGDALLQAVASILNDCSRETDVVARLGGDEFAVLVVHPKDKEAAALSAARIVDRIRQPMKVMGHDIRIGTSVGIALYPSDAEDEDGLTKKADLALYEAKEAGRNTYRFYRPDGPSDA